MNTLKESKRFALRLFGLAAVVLLCLGTWATAKSGEFPDFISMSGSARGVAVDKVGNVYVSISVGTSSTETIYIQKFSPDGEPLFPNPVLIGNGTIGGLMVSANGDLYIALAAWTHKGVYRMDRKGAIELLPGSNQILFANGLAFDDVGTLYITESVSMPLGLGGIWRIRRGGQAERCLQHPLLTGNLGLGLGFPMGANGIAYYHGDLYVTNTEQGTIVRIPLWPDGSVGTPELWTTLDEVPESPFANPAVAPMGDGLALDVFGNLYVAVLTRSAIVRINLYDKSQETVAAFLAPPTPSARLDFPASLFFGTGKGVRTNLFVTNLGLGSSKVPLPPPLSWAGSGLVKIDAGVPGRPLH